MIFAVDECKCGAGFLFAYKRKIALHPEWATRSYAIALVFIAGCFVLGVTGWEALGVEIAQAVLPRAVSRVGRRGHPLERNSCGFEVPVKSGVAPATAKPGVSRKQNMFLLPMGEG